MKTLRHFLIFLISSASAILFVVASLFALPVNAAVVDATYNNPTNVPVTASSYTATGNTVNFTLNHTPATGATLTVVKNTGLSFINGTFDNLTQGQAVVLSYSGTTYHFVANYFGGSGNDLVLQWTATRPVAWGYNYYGQLGNGGVASSEVPVAASTTGVLAGKTLIALTGGSSHSLALCSDGTLAAWGNNGYGQLGDGSTTQSNVPLAVDRTGVLSSKTVVAVAAGNYHSLALCSDGTLAAWGINSSGQLGNGTTTQSNVPVAVDQTGTLAAKTVVAVAAGSTHSLALCSDGTLFAWGNNSNGQLGNGNTTQSSVPVAVDRSGVLSGRAVTTMAGGDSHSLALCADGKLVAWGYNTYGQLGNSSTTQSTVPVAVDQTGVLSGKSVVAVAAGSYHSLALASDGKLAAWGYNYYGQLGNAGSSNILVPVAVSTTGGLASKTVSSIAGGGSGSIALCTDRTAAAWGANDYGQLGNGSTTSSNVPVAVNRSTLASNEYFMVVTSARNASHSLGIVAMPCVPRIAIEAAGGAGLTSGRDTVDFGGTAVGHGVSMTFTIRNSGFVPLTVGSLTLDGTNAADFAVTTPPLASVAVGASTTFEVTFTAGAEFNRSAVLHVASNDPGTGVFNINLTGIGSGLLAATYSTGAEVPLTSGNFTATGSNVNFALNHAPATGTQLTVVSNTGLGFIKGTFDNLAQGQMVTMNYGGVAYKFVANYYGGSGNDLVLQWAPTRPVAWGNNSSGQLGNASLTNNYVPTAMSTAGLLADRVVVALASGSSHSLALCADGTLAAWGNNSYGQLGTGNTSTSNVPVAVDRTGALYSKTVVAVATGDSYSLALCSDGTLAAWGYNNYGQLGIGNTTNSNLPVAVNTTGALAGKTVIAVAAGDSHVLALCSDGTLVAWGYNGNGQLGNGNTSQSNVPVAVSTSGVLSGKTVAAVAAGDSHSLALCSDGTLAAWGYNSSGQLGNGNTTSSSLPLAVDRTGVLAGKTLAAVAAGGSHSLAWCTDGTLTAWGSNNWGQLTNNGTTSSTSYVPVVVNPAGGLAGKTIVTTAAGNSHTLALCSDGTLTAWGYNNIGQLGNGTATDSSVPVTVSRANLALGEKFVAANSNQSASHNLGIVALPLISRIVVEQPAGSGLVSGRGTLDFGIVPTGTVVSKTFTIRNNGIVPLVINSVTLDGANAAEFALTTPPAASVAAGGNTTFVVTFTAGPRFTRSAVVHIASNDPYTGVFDVNLTATVPGVLAASYNTGLEVPLICNGFTATGSSVNFSLNFAPATGTRLTVVRNTGPGFINGTFDNLAHGQVVTFNFGGGTYKFVANYYGGSGNDLVLEWGATRLMTWGYNNHGQLGNGSTTNSSMPTAVSTAGVLTDKTIIAVAVGGSHSLALCSDGTLAACGYNNYGQLGNGTTTDSTAPVAVNTAGALFNKTVVAVAAGSSHSLALCSDGTLAAWGNNGNGQMGVGNTTASSNVPMAVNTAGVLAG